MQYSWLAKVKWLPYGWREKYQKSCVTLRPLKLTEESKSQMIFMTTRAVAAVAAGEKLSSSLQCGDLRERRQ